MNTLYKRLGTSTMDVLFALKIPNSLFKRWSEVTKSTQKATVSYINLLNYSISGGAFLVKTRT